jgi:hypothetical protein
MHIESFCAQMYTLYLDHSMFISSDGALIFLHMNPPTCPDFFTTPPSPAPGPTNYTQPDCA